MIAMDREGDRRFCYINAAHPFANDVPPDEWRCGQPNARTGIFGVINDDFVGPARDDGLQNGDESDVDCGGTCAGDDGSACGLDTDCDSGLCEAGACVAAPSCDDGVQNGNEVGGDCGGDCDGCGAGAVCQDDETAPQA